MVFWEEEKEEPEALYAGGWRPASVATVRVKEEGRLGRGSHRTPALAFALKDKGKKPLESSEQRSDRNSLEEFKEYSGCSLGTRVEGLQYSKSRSRENS